MLDHGEKLLRQLIVVKASRDQKLSVHNAQHFDRVGDRVGGNYAVMISMSQNSICISCKSPVEDGLITCSMIQSYASGPL